MDVNQSLGSDGIARDVAEKSKFSGDDDRHAVSIDAALERRIVRKFDTHILPWLFGIWLFAFIDRSNIGNAKIDGLTTDLDLTGNRFNVALTVFYVLYILVNVPSNWVLKRVGGGLYLPALITCWGLVGTCMGLTKSYGGLIVCRLLLGLFEGGLFGGMILYLSMFYRRHELLLRLGLWYCAAPLSGAIGGLLAAGLSQIKYGGYNKWPWIFIVEGSITVLFGLISFFFLPHTPDKSKFLIESEKEGALSRLRIDARGSNAESKVDLESFSWAPVKAAVFNVNTVLCSLNFLFILVPVYSYSLFLPTIISGLGYKNVVAQLFTVPPNACGFFAVIIVSVLSDRYKIRGPFIIGCSILAIIGYIMLLAGPTASIQYGGTFFVAVGIFPSSPAVCAWLNNNLAPHYTRATGTGVQVGVGNLAAFIATFTYLSTDAPRYVTGHSINLGMLGLVILTTAMTMWYCAWENRIRQRGGREEWLQGSRREDLGQEKGVDGVYGNAIGVQELGHRHPEFRYTL